MQTEPLIITPTLQTTSYFLFYSVRPNGFIFPLIWAFSPHLNKILSLFSHQPCQSQFNYQFLTSVFLNAIYNVLYYSWCMYTFGTNNYFVRVVAVNHQEYCIGVAHNSTCVCNVPDSSNTTSAWCIGGRF